MIDIVQAIAILVSAIVLAWLVNYLSRVLKSKLTAPKLASTFSITIDSTVRPVTILIIVEGILLAALSLPALQSWRTGLELGSKGAVIILATYGLARVFASLLNWQFTKADKRSKKPVDPGMARFLERITQITIYVVGLLFLLDYLGVSISPLIASLGIGGLAVALALQPTLSNFFAGVQVVSDRMARMGDFIEIDEKIRGYVTEIGWRSTKIRTSTNNIIIIPNSILANSQVTNYNLPSTPLAVMVYCGVSYDSDLAHVKQVALEVANDVIQRRYEAVKAFEPMVGFEKFEDSNVSFWVWMQAIDRLSSFNLKSELIIALHERFKRENITINYPVRTVYMKQPSESRIDPSPESSE